MADQPYIVRSYSLPAQTVHKLQAIAEARHGRVRHMLSATLDDVIQDAFQALSPGQQAKAAQYTEEADDASGNIRVPSDTSTSHGHYEEAQHPRRADAAPLSAGGRRRVARAGAGAQ